MIIIDHLGIGFTLINSIRKERWTILSSFALVAAIIPDLDILWSGGAGSIPYLQYHRLWSHSVIVLLPIFTVAAIVLTSYLRKNDPEISFHKVWFILLLCGGSHLLFDLFTPYGIPLFYPLWSARYSLDIWHDFDPIVSLISIVSIITIYLTRKYLWTHKVVSLCLLAYGIYFIITIVNREISRAQLAPQLDANTSFSIQMIPRTFWRWKGIVKNSDHFIVLTQNAQPETLSIVRKEVLPKSFSSDKTTDIFLDYARFPAFVTSNDSLLCFYNLAYSKKNYMLTATNKEIYRHIVWHTSTFDLVDN